MSERIRGFWSTFSEIYGPAIVGGVFLCVADLVQSEANGQLGKLGRVIGKPLQASVQAELVGFLAILALGCLLCWVFRPATRSDSFSKGASVFAILAAMVPAGVAPGGLSSDNALKTSPTPEGAMNFISPAQAQTVIPLTPKGKIMVHIVAGDGVKSDELQASVAKDGVGVTLFDAKTRDRIGYERIRNQTFEIARAPGRYILEIEISGFDRVRGEIELTQETRVVDLQVSRRSVVPLGIQRLYSAAPLVASNNERNTLIERGKDASRRGQYQVALEYYEKALAMNERDKETLNYKGYALFRLQRFEEAYKTLSSARKIDGNYFLAKLNFVKVACRLGRGTEATTALVGGNPLTPRESQVALQDGELMQACQSSPATLNALAAAR